MLLLLSTFNRFNYVTLKSLANLCIIAVDDDLLILFFLRRGPQETDGEEGGRGRHHRTPADRPPAARAATSRGVPLLRSGHRSPDPHPRRRDEKAPVLTSREAAFVRTIAVSAL